MQFKFNVGAASAIALTIAGVPQAGWPPASGTVSVSFSPSDPQVGEVINFATTMADATPVDPTLLQSRWVRKTYGSSDPFIHYTSEDSNLSHGWNDAHVYKTAGSKTVDVDTWVTGGAIETIQVPVTVTDPDAYAWSKVYWVDFNGSTTGMAAADATNIHILSEAAYKAISETGTDIRVRFRGGVTHTLTPTSTSDRANFSGNFVRIDTFGTGYATVNVLAGAAAFDFGAGQNFSLFTTGVGSVNARRIITGIKKTNGAGYNPLTGEFPELASNLISADGTVPRISLYDCEISGCHRGFERPGTASAPVKGGIYDCLIEKYQDYAVTMGGDEGFAIMGCDIPQQPFAARGDSKHQVEFDFIDHAAIRNNGPQKFHVSQNKGATSGGWSGFGYDKAIQQFVRAHTEDSPSGALTECLFNKTSARSVLFSGHHSAGSTQQNPSYTLVVGNDHYYPSHGVDLVTNNGAGGNVVFSNVMNVPDIDYAQTNGGDATVLHIADSSGPVADAVKNAANYVGFNTILSDANTRWSGAGAMAATDLGTGHVATTEHNIFAGDNMTSGATHLAATLSRGGSLQPITGSAAESATAGGPPISFDKVPNTAGSTNIGAHDAAGANVAVSDPTLTSVSIARLTGWSAERGVEGYGITSYSGLVENDEFVAIGWHWLLDGVDFAKTTGGDPTRDMFLPVIDLEAQTGSLELDITLMNRSGNKVVVRSNALTVT